MSFGIAAALQAQTAAVTIDYTGSLYGYYRMEPSETTAVLPPVKRFLEARAKPTEKDKLLLGMGDNFGPEFGAALQMEDGKSNADPCYLPPVVDTSKYHETRPQSLYKDDDRVAPAAQCDNVLNFMMHAGYRAIVPGREDFMYTARWLRVSAQRLQEASVVGTGISNPDHALFMLGANLRIESKGQSAEGAESKGEGAAKGKPGQKGGGKTCPLLFSKEPLSPEAAPCYSPGQPEALEYLDRLDRLEMNHGRNAVSQAVEHSAANSATSKDKSDLVSLVRDQVNIFISAWGGRKLSAWKLGVPIAALIKQVRPLPETGDSMNKGMTDSLVKDVAQDLKTLNDLELAKACPSADALQDNIDMCWYMEELIARLNHLQAALNGKPLTDPPNLPFCPSEKGSSNPPEEKFILSDCAREAAIRGVLRSIWMEQEELGYTVAGGSGRPRVLIIGVAGPDTKNGISQTNLDLCPAARSEKGEAPTDFDTCNRPDDAKGANAKTLVEATKQVTITDPVAVTAALVRAVELRVYEQKEAPLDAVVVMAQMTHTEAEVFSARVKRELAQVDHPDHVHQESDQDTERVQRVDLVLSEAEEAYSTPSVTLNYTPAAGKLADHTAPVFTPLKNYSSSTGSFPGTVYEAKVNYVDRVSYSISNEIERQSDLPDTVPHPTIAGCFMKLVTELKSSKWPPPGEPSGGCVDPKTSAPAKAAQTGTDEQNNATDEARRDELVLFETLQKAVTPRADIVLLESRDLQLDSIYPAYTKYEDVCRGEEKEKGKDKPQLCRLRIALDRIFWKGDYLEFVAVKGTDLAAMIDLSNKKMDNRTELVDQDITGEWLVTYGIVQSSLKNVTQVNRNNEPLWIPVDKNCKGPSPEAHVYCVGGSPLVNDQYYWLLTSDHLAQDAQVYGTLQKLPKIEHETSRYFLTEPLAHYLLASLEKDDKTRQAVMTVASSACASSDCVEADVASRNALLQQMPLWQMDFLKVVANFTSRSPVGGNQFVGSYFQGVSDSRATAPSQQELDLEFANRVTGDLLGTFSKNKTPSRFSEGVQTSFGYDRSVVGNLTPATKAINSSYALNNLTVGGFVQMRLGHKEKDLPLSVRSLPRWLLVLTPYQYQIQVNHQYLFFPFANSSPLPGELTATLPRNTSWTDRAGFRREFASGRKYAFMTGSYMEAGGEYVIQNNVLSGITLANGATQKTCLVNANITLQTCFSQPPQFVITSNTQLVHPVMVKDLHSPGLYWNFHLQNKFIGKTTLVADTQGDYYFGRTASAELPTQTQYAIPFSASLVFPAMGNFSFAPTYSAFFYSSQLSSQSLQVNSFSITARWYLARDNRVPVVRQSRLPGPESSDQTKTAKGH